MCIFASNCQKVMEMVLNLGKVLLVCLKDWPWVSDDGVKIEFEINEKMQELGTCLICDGQTISFTDNLQL